MQEEEEEGMVAELIAFIQQQRTRAESGRKSRVEEASAWRTGTAADHEAARQMAERMSGRSMPKHTPEEREANARRAGSIAATLAQDVARFDAVLTILAAFAASRCTCSPPSFAHEEHDPACPKAQTTRALASGDPGSGWRSMESADKHGPPIWVWYLSHLGTRCSAVARWSERHNNWWTDAGSVTARGWQPYVKPNPPASSPGGDPA